MKTDNFSSEGLPMAELEKYGLAEKGKILLAPSAVRAILEGRRTDMISLYNVEENGQTIKQIDVKISVAPDKGGTPHLVFHPNYKEAPYPDFLTDQEAEKLQNGQTVNITKKIKDDDGEEKQVIVEFDPENKEFVITDKRRIPVPDTMNDELLSEAQKELFRDGKEVELSDGTKFRYAGTESFGIKANRYALIASILFDGGISFVLYHGLRSLITNGTQGTKEQAYTEGYLRAKEKYDTQQKEKIDETQGFSAAVKNQQTRGVGR